MTGLSHRQRHPANRLTVRQQPHRFGEARQRHAVRNVRLDPALSRPDRIAPSAARRRARDRGASLRRRGRRRCSRPFISTRLVRASPMPPVKPTTRIRAPQAMQRRLCSNTSPPTGSNTTIGAATLRDPLHRVAERLAIVANEMIGAAGARHFQLLVARRRRDHLRAERLAEFDRSESHAAAGAVHQQHLARLADARARPAHARRCRGRRERSRPPRRRSRPAMATTCPASTTTSSA